MNIVFTPKGWDDYVYWQQNDPEVLKKINLLIKDIARDPFKGLGKPEPLRSNLAGCWSRRITGEHRLVYFVQGFKDEQRIVVLQTRFHY